MTQAGLLELIGACEAIFDAGALADAGVFDPDANGDDDAPQAFGLGLDDTGSPANPAFAKALGGRFICALDNGTIAAWGGKKPMPSGWVSRFLVFYQPDDQRA